MQHPYDNRSARCLPAYWGKWFIPIKDSTMKATDLSVFYQLGASLTYLIDHAKIDDPAGDLYIWLTLPCQWLVAFRSQTEEVADTFKDTRVVVDHFIHAIHGLMESIPKEWDRPITQAEVVGLSYWKDKLEEAFEREHRNLDVFTVTPKGLYNTRLLIEAPVRQFPERLRTVLPPQMSYDLEQAGRCLAFDLPTACAFHICRGTEALMIAYYEALAEQKWPHKKKDWNIYIEQLIAKDSPKRITDRLKEIQAGDRNAYIHPDINVELDEAQILFNLCAAVNFYMAEEMVKLSI